MHLKTILQSLAAVCWFAEAYSKNSEDLTLGIKMGTKTRIFVFELSDSAFGLSTLHTVKSFIMSPQVKAASIEIR